MARSAASTARRQLSGGMSVQSTLTKGDAVGPPSRAEEPSHAPAKIAAAAIGSRMMPTGRRFPIRPDAS
jgi:hypothetical protein